MLTSLLFAVSIAQVRDDFSIKSPPPKYNLGISVGANGYAVRAFADMFQGDARLQHFPSFQTAPVDSTGHPTSDFSIFFFDGWFAEREGGRPYNGTYRLQFRGQADFPTNWLWGGEIRNKQYDAETNTTTADYVVTEGYPAMRIIFENTRRTPASPLDSGVTGLKMMRPKTVGGSDPYPFTAVFTQEFLDVHRRGTTLRSMDFVGTNGSITKEWSEVNRPHNIGFYNEAPGYWWQGKGAPWEYFIDLCNETKRDCWVNVPLLASDDYVRQLCRLLKSRLDPDLKIYVEYSNELWNFGFPQWSQMSELTRNEIAANPNIDYNYDGRSVRPNGEVDAGISVPRRWARRIMQISDIFRSEFGDSAMHDGRKPRVFPLFMWMAAWGHWTWAGMDFLCRYYNNEDGQHVANPRPPSSYIWGAGGSAYYHGFPDDLMNRDDLTEDEILKAYDRYMPVHDKVMSHNTYWASTFGFKRVSYESGPGIDGNGHSDPIKMSTQYRPEMKGIYRRITDSFYRTGGELYTTFLAVNVTHGLVPFESILGNQPRPKLEAFDAMLKLPSRPKPTIGYPLATNIPGNRFVTHSNGWSEGNSSTPTRLANEYMWLGFTLRSDVRRKGRISLITQNGVNGQMRVWVDGKPVGTVDVPADQRTSVLDVNIPTGVFGVRLERRRGAFEVVSFRVE